ncbi:unnamed protein product [Musa hybrid cultivar]
MAYRRKQPAARISTTFEDPRSAASAAEAQASLATRAIRASAAHRDASSLSSAYGESAVSSPHNESHRMRSSPPPQRFHHVDPSPEIYQKTETTHKRSDAIGSSLNHIGGTIKNAIEEGLTIVENKTANIIHETRKLNIRRKGNAATMQGQAAEKLGQEYIPQIQTEYETQLKASRDVANAMAAKAKLLLRELKTVKADLIFTRERCAQLEEENKMLRESHEKGDCPEDDDLIRLQLETLLVEKARLAHENSIYARENRFLREIVEYHQLTMQDVVYVDEGVEEVTEVYMTPNASLTLTRAASEASTGFISTPLAPARTNSSPATLQPSLLPLPSIIVPEDCPIVPMQPPLSVPPKSTLPPQSAA